MGYSTNLSKFQLAYNIIIALNLPNDEVTMHKIVKLLDNFEFVPDQTKNEKN